MGVGEETTILKPVRVTGNSITHPKRHARRVQHQFEQKIIRIMIIIGLTYMFIGLLATILLPNIPLLGRISLGITSVITGSMAPIPALLMRYGKLPETL